VQLHDQPRRDERAEDKERGQLERRAGQDKQPDRDREEQLVRFRHPEKTRAAEPAGEQWNHDADRDPKK
jgi:hypothetical protein